MLETWNRPQTSIRHVTLRYRGTATADNLPSLRLRTERLLGSVDLQPPGLPSGALLIVRKLQSLPGSPPLSASIQPQQAWIDHLRTQMATLYRTAVRPALNTVSPAATSVLFADAAEMLVCLTRDVLNERVWQQWYWQQMLRHVPPTPGSALTALWSEQAAFVPAMLGYLKTAEARAAIALLTDQEVSQVISALNASFDLPSPRHIPVLAQVLAPTTASQPLHPSPTVLSPEEPLVEQIPAQDSPVLPPWQRWLDALMLEPLTPHSQYLLGLIVTLYYAPTFARSITFITQAVSWLNTELHSSGRACLDHLPPHDRVEPRPRREMAEASSAITNPHGVVSSGRACLDHLLPPDHLPPPGTTDDTSKDVLFGKLQPFPTNDTSDTTDTSDTNDVLFSTAQPFPTDGLLTELGGILYLIHLLKWLDLPASWPEGAILAEHLGSWGIIELLARGLLGDLYDRYLNDPIWHVLAMLAAGTRFCSLKNTCELSKKPIAAHRPFGYDCRPRTLSGGEVIIAGTADLSALAGWSAIRMNLLQSLIASEPDTLIGAALPAQTVFRLPAKCLLRYGTPHPSWIAATGGQRLYLVDKDAGYLVVDMPLGERSLDEAINVEVDAYMAQGLQASIVPVGAGAIPTPTIHGLGWPIRSMVGALGLWGRRHPFAVALGGWGALVGCGLPPPDEGRRAFPYEHGHFDVPIHPHALWWLERVIGFVRYLLIRALNEPTFDAHALPETLLCKHGWLVAGRTHIDLYMSMEQISLPIRRAGLDCDPAWVPDLARIVLFHFGQET